MIPRLFSDSIPVPNDGVGFVARNKTTVKKYIVTLSDEERAQLSSLIQTRKTPGPEAVDGRILLKADASDNGEGWSEQRDRGWRWKPAPIRLPGPDSGWSKRVLRQLLTRKHSPNSARKRIFDGAAEGEADRAGLFEAPAGRARWTLELLEEKVVELEIVEQASDNTIGQRH